MGGAGCITRRAAAQDTIADDVASSLSADRAAADRAAAKAAQQVRHLTDAQLTPNWRPTDAQLAPN